MDWLLSSKSYISFAEGVPYTYWRKQLLGVTTSLLAGSPLPWATYKQHILRVNPCATLQVEQPWCCVTRTLTPAPRRLAALRTTTGCQYLGDTVNQGLSRGGF